MKTRTAAEPLSDEELSTLRQMRVDLDRFAAFRSDDVRVLLDIIDRLDVTPAVGTEGLTVALVDLTAAYHSERAHPGRWDACQRPRCQNARLAMLGRGPFAAVLGTPR